MRLISILTGIIIVAGAVAAAIIIVANGNDDSEANNTTTTSNTTTQTTTAQNTNTNQLTSSYTIDVWADNWFALYVNGQKVGEDSVSIRTERSFNKETFSFDATLPMTVAIEAKDYIETDSGLEYIGANNQQMGDGGIIAQIKDASGNTVASTSGDWKAFVTHFAPLDKSCESSNNPETDCLFTITESPTNWTTVAFDDSGWDNASVYTEAQVSPKDGYNEVIWDSAAQFIWGQDLEQVNTVLLRTQVQ